MQPNDGFLDDKDCHWLPDVMKEDIEKYVSFRKSCGSDIRLEKLYKFCSNSNELLVAWEKNMIDVFYLAVRQESCARLEKFISDKGLGEKEKVFFRGNHAFYKYKVFKRF